MSGYGNATWGSPVRAYSANYDVFAAKLDSSGNLVWNTFLGGNDNDFSWSGMTIDSSRNLYITGYSGATWGSPVRAFNGSDIFAVKVGPSGNLVWNSFLGGTGQDVGYGIALDSSDKIFITGYSTATWGSPVQAYTGNADIAIIKLDTSGNLLWNFFLGGANGDIGYDIKIDSNLNIYIAGPSNSTWGNPVISYTGGSDAIVAKLSLPVISGTITNGGSGLADVVLSGLPGDPVTDASGDYSSGRIGRAGRSRPALLGYSFSPATRTYTNIAADYSAQDYTSQAPVAPSVTTTAASNITIYGATSGGNIISDNGAEVTTRGVCWSTSADPTTTDSHTSDGSGKGSFTSSLTGLSTTRPSIFAPTPQTRSEPPTAMT